METTHWAFAAMLGLSLAASTGLNTFLPLFLLSGASHFGYFNAASLLNGNFAWLASGGALTALAIATTIEVVGDKIPAVDHFLDVVGTVARPAVGTFAAASVFTGADPATAALAGLVIGAPTAFGFHAAKAGTRVGSTATTAGIGNPVLSVMEDIAAVAMTLIGIAFPLLLPVLLLVAFGILFLVYRKIRRHLPRRNGAGPLGAAR
ncbi:MAG TPA: DUF4126 domain-containing protein [Abditibacteriaceae bacterium]|jgi:hypothetical protein